MARKSLGLGLGSDMVFYSRCESALLRVVSVRKAYTGGKKFSKDSFTHLCPYGGSRYEKARIGAGLRALNYFYQVEGSPLTPARCNAL